MLGSLPRVSPEHLEGKRRCWPNRPLPKRRQYELVDVARQRGFRDNEVIDADLGRSASGLPHAPASSG
jgi:hypothetical protein